MKVASFLIVLHTSMLHASPADTLSTPRLEVEAVRLAEPVVIDGILSESIWQNGFGVSDFTQPPSIRISDRWRSIRRLSI